MYQIQTDKANAIIEFVIDGYIRVEEMQRFVKELRAVMLSFMGREFKVKADLRTYKPASPEVTEVIREIQAFGLRNGMKRVAELVESQIVALQMNRVARESGMEKILRRFWEEADARRWLIHGDLEETSSSQ
ncbi:MAG: STAS/SEC14 domain-containing protein [Myxococcaceae bacterium]|nr:STAS/SEC14 domain-containing protein [Myxococcaceae bacterium]